MFQLCIDSCNQYIFSFQFLQWELNSRENGDVSFFLYNRSTEKLPINASFYLRGSSIFQTQKWTIDRVFQPNRSWGYDEFIKKDQLENHMQGVVDKSGHLNIHLEICCKNTFFSDNLRGRNGIDSSLFVYVLHSKTYTNKANYIPMWPLW